MHHGDWNDGWGGGSWWWIPMVIMMIAFWGGLIWLAIALFRRTSHPAVVAPSGAPPAMAPPATPPAPRPTPQEILAERLARGEIEPDDYQRRIEALTKPPQ